MARSKTQRESATHEATHKPWPLTERPGFLIRRLHQIHVALFNEACGAFDLTPVQYSVLSALAERGSADQTTLAADVFLDRTTTTGVLKRLASRKLIERAVSDEDRRARDCRITPAGTVLLAKMETVARSAHLDTVAHLGKRDQKILIAMMQRIVLNSSNNKTGTSDI